MGTAGVGPDPLLHAGPDTSARHPPVGFPSTRCGDGHDRPDPWPRGAGCRAGTGPGLRDPAAGIRGQRPAGRFGGGGGSGRPLPVHMISNVPAGKSCSTPPAYRRQIGSAIGSTSHRPPGAGAVGSLPTVRSEYALPPRVQSRVRSAVRGTPALSTARPCRVVLSARRDNAGRRSAAARGELPHNLRNPCPDRGGGAEQRAYRAERDRGEERAAARAPDGREVGQACRVAAASRSPSSSIDARRISTLRTLPLTVIGNSSTMRTYRGIL